MRAACLAGMLLVIAAAICASPGDGSTPTRQATCTSHGVRAAIVSFIDAYNRGDSERLDSLFAEEPDFEWFSTDGPTSRFGREARNRGTLLDYFRARHARHDRLALVSFGFNGNSPRYGNFEVAMRRSADGYRDGRWLRMRGKGATICAGDSTEFIVMSYGALPPRFD